MDSAFATIAVVPIGLRHPPRRRHRLDHDPGNICAAISGRTFFSFLLQLTSRSIVKPKQHSALRLQLCYLMARTKTTLPREMRIIMHRLP